MFSTCTARSWDPVAAPQPTCLQPQAPSSSAQPPAYLPACLLLQAPSLSPQPPACPCLVLQAFIFCFAPTPACCCRLHHIPEGPSRQLTLLTRPVPATAPSSTGRGGGGGEGEGVRQQAMLKHAWRACLTVYLLLCALRLKTMWPSLARRYTPTPHYTAACTCR
jgi:hypothetical protein